MGKIIPSHTKEFFDNMNTDDANEIIEEIMNILRKHKVTVGDAEHLLKATIYAINKETTIS